MGLFNEQNLSVVVLSKNIRRCPIFESIKEAPISVQFLNR